MNPITLLKNTFSGNYNHVLGGALAVMFGCYLFFIAGTVIAINERKDIRTETRDLESVVADLEINYFALTAAIDRDTAQTLGFNDATPNFVYTKEQADSVAVR